MNITCPNRAHLQKGFSLIEVLIALFILSIGLLGLAGMQLLGLRMNNDAFTRTHATSFAYSIAEQMRLDPENASMPIATNPYKGTLTAAVSSATCIESVVTVPDILNCWQVTLRDRMPSGSIAISAPGDGGYPALCDTTNALASDELAVEILWSDSWNQEGSTSTETSCQTFLFTIRNG